MKRWVYSISCLLLSLSLVACGTNNAARTQNQAGPAPAKSNTTGIRSFGYATSQKPATHPGVAQPGVTPPSVAQPGHITQNTHTATTFDHHLAKKVAQAADNVPGVDGATSVVRGNEVVVGINTRVSNTTATQQTVIERQVHSAVRAIAPNHHIRVTSDATMVTRIRTLASNITGYGKEMTTGPNTVGANLANAGNDFMALVRDLGRTATAPFR
ncbi:YhcN/YlaJ family sporulation lipoprotein [Brevibacillus sp. SYSU BS000544]|uniref:YhcN/YlaJ family sporulation lipoprotein n=1 Tax=Brevibacillus sp. SYSU BS000544 TaxID=3416443 RepID=UPI003CE576AB